MIKRSLTLVLCALCLIALCSCALFDSLDQPTVDPNQPYPYDLDEYLELAPYKGLSVSRAQIEPTQEQIDAQIESDFGSLRLIYDRTADFGDRVNLNYLASYEGNDYEDGTENGFFLTLGQNELELPGFDEGLVGVYPGESAELDLHFPEDYTKDPDYAGKDVHFTVTLNYIYADLPELSDELVSAYTTYPTLAAYQTGMKESLTRANKVTALWKQVLDRSRVLQYPEKEYQVYYEDFVKSYQLLAEGYSLTLSEYLDLLGESEESFDQRANEETQNYIKEDLIVYAIARRENLEVSEDEYTEGKQDYYDKVVFDYFLNPDLMEETLGKDYLTEHLLANKVLDLICDSAVENA